MGLLALASGLLVANAGGNNILQVDPLTGNRSIVSEAGVGSGPTFEPIEMAFDGVGNLIVSAQQGIFGVDPLTGNRSVISSSSVGSGPAAVPAGIGVATNGTIFVNAPSASAVFAVDPLTGNRTILSDATHGAGPAFLTPQGLLVVPNVPEPSTIMLATFGVRALLAYRWRIV